MLNEGQQEVVDYLVNDFPASREAGFTILGEGGTGKTTSIMHAVPQWLSQGRKVLLCAPTNKAVQQLAKAGGGIADKSLFLTLHKALGLALLPDSERKYAAQKGASLVGDFDIVVLDEGSMVSSVVLQKYLLPQMQNTKLVVMGDRMQLFPVREMNSPALSLYPKMELTKVERFKASSHISRATNPLRNAINVGGSYNFSGDSMGVPTILPAHFAHRVAEAFTEEGAIDSTKALAWSNARVSEINATVRAKIYGRGVEPYIVGERLLAGAPIYDPVTEESLVNTDDTVIVKAIVDASILWEDTGDEFKTRLLTLEEESSGITAYAHTLHESEAARLAGRLKTYAAEAEKDRRRWALYHKLRDSFSDLRYTYCLTVHRSQGSSIERVFVDADNILRNRSREERNRLLYVAMSRASDKLYVGKNKFIS